MTANERIRDEAIRHAFQFERIRAGLNRDALVYFNRELVPKIEGLLAARLARIEARGRDLGPATTRRLSALVDDVRELVTGGTSELRELVANGLQDAGRLEAAWMRKTIVDAAGFEVLGVNMTLPSASQIRQIVRGETVRGRLLWQHFSKLTTDTVGQIRTAIDVGIVSGQTNEQIVRSLIGTRKAGFADGILNTSRRGAMAIVRTSATHVSARARAETFAANDDIVKSEQWLSTLDTKTTVTCIELDGQVFKIGHGERPPAHWGCRSSVIPVLRSWRELGIDLDDAPPGTRESLDGRVAESRNAESWLRDQSKARQEESLGKTRARWFREGKLTISQMAAQDGRPLTVAALAKRYDLAI